MATIIPMKKAADETLLRYRDLEGLLEELALVSDVCKTLFEFEMTKAKTMAERLGGDQTWAPISQDTVERLGFLLRDLDERIELLNRDFYAADPDPEYFSHMNRDPAA